MRLRDLWEDAVFSWYRFTNSPCFYYHVKDLTVGKHFIYGPYTYEFCSAVIENIFANMDKSSDILSVWVYDHPLMYRDIPVSLRNRIKETPRSGHY